MANPSTLEIDEQVLTNIAGLLEAEATSAPASNFPAVVSTQPDIPALREQLAVLVSTGKSKEAIGTQLSHDDVKRLSDKDVEKYIKRYHAYVGSKTTDSLLDGFLFVLTKAVGMVVKIKDIEAYQKEIKNDWIINNQLSNMAGSTALTCGRGLAVANAAMITAKHIDFDSFKHEAQTTEIAELSSPTAEHS